MQNKVVFTQEELSSILPAQEDIYTMGVLQRVQWFGISSKTMSYNFIHLSIQELLAAYCISKMKESEQVRVFQTLLGEPRFSAVLHFYAGFTKLTNQGVRNIITGTDFTSYKSSQLSLLSYMRCFFEAQVCDKSFYQQIIPRLNWEMDISFITMSPLDCIAFGFFLAFVLRNTSELCVDLSYCSIDDHSLSVLMGELSKHAEPSMQEGVLHGVIKLNISYNKIRDNGIACIATALWTNTTMRTLYVCNCDISDEGIESLARALAVNRSLLELNISNNQIWINGIAHIATALQTNNTLQTLKVYDCSVTDEGAVLLSSALTTNRSMECLELDWSSTHPDSTLKEIGECFRKSTLRILTLRIFRPQPSGVASTVEQVKEWLQCAEVGGKELIQSLEDSRLQIVNLIWVTYSGTCDVHEHKSHVRQVLTTTANSRKNKGINCIEFTVLVK